MLVYGDHLQRGVELHVSERAVLPKNKGALLFEHVHVTQNFPFVHQEALLSFVLCCCEGIFWDELTLRALPILRLCGSEPAPVSAALYTAFTWTSAVSLVLVGKGSVKPYMCSSCQLAICPYVLKTSSPFLMGRNATIFKHSYREERRDFFSFYI